MKYLCRFLTFLFLLLGSTGLVLAGPAFPYVVTPGGVGSNNIFYNPRIWGGTGTFSGALSGTFTGSGTFSGHFYGDGSHLTNLPASSQTPWITDENAAGYSLYNLGTLVFDDGFGDTNSLYLHLGQWFQFDNGARFDGEVRAQKFTVISPTSSAVAATIQGAAGQSTNLFEVKDSSSAMKLRIAYTGETTATNFIDSHNVKYWGAKGDGATDDTAALQAALNFATNGSKIFMPSGVYWITNTLRFPSHKVTLEGSDPSMTYDSSPTNGAVIVAKAAIESIINTTTNRYCTVRNVKLDCNSLATNGLTFSTQTEIEYCEVRNALWAGYLGTNLVNQSSMSHCSAVSCGTGLKVISGGGQATMMPVVHCVFELCGTAVEIGSGNIHFEDCVMESSSRYGLLSYWDGGIAYPGPCIFEHCWFEDNPINVMTTTNVLLGFTFTDCWFNPKNAASTNLCIPNAFRWVLERCHFRADGPQTNSMTGASYTTFRDCTIFNNSGALQPFSITNALGGTSTINLQSRDGKWVVETEAMVGGGVIHNTFDRSGNLIMEGSIGVGTNAPSQAIEVVGNVKATAFIGDGSSLTNVNLDGHRTLTLDALTYTPSTLTLAASADNVRTYGIGSVNGGTNGMFFGIKDNLVDAERIVIDNYGNVGIGVTNAAAKLDVAGNVLATGFIGNGIGITNIGTVSNLTVDSLVFNPSSITLKASVDNVRSYGIGVANGGTNGASLSIRDNLSATDRLIIDSYGRVGINTTNPQYALDVNGVIRGDGSQITNLNGTSIATGTVAGDRISIDGVSITLNGANQLQATGTGGMATNVIDMAASTGITIVTNGLLRTISVTPSTYDPYGAATAATNGYAWTNLPVVSATTAGSANAVAAGVSNAWQTYANSVTNGFPWTNLTSSITADVTNQWRLDATNAATATTNGFPWTNIVPQYAVSSKNSTNFWGQLSVTNYNGGVAASSSTFLRGDGTWVSPSGGSATNVIDIAAGDSSINIVTNDLLRTLTVGPGATNAWQTYANGVTNGYAWTNLAANSVVSGISNQWRVDATNAATATTNGYAWTNLPVVSATTAGSANAVAAGVTNAWQTYANSVTNGYPWTNLTSSLTSEVTNQWRTDATNAATAVTNGYPWTNIYSPGISGGATNQVYTQVGWSGYPQVTNLSLITNGIGTAILPTLWLTNPTPAALGAQQASPALMLGGQGWRSGNSTTMPVQMGMYVLPVQGSSANPLGRMLFVHSTSNVAPVTAAYIDATVAGGNFTASGTVNGSSVGANNNGYFTWSGRSGMVSPSNGDIQMFNTAETAFSRLYLGKLTADWPAIKVESSTNNPAISIRTGADANYASLVASNMTAVGNITTPNLTVSNNLTLQGTLTVSNISGNFVHSLYQTNGYTICTAAKDFYLVNAYTNPMFILPDASTVTGQEFVFSTTNVACFFVVTNKTGNQTVGNGRDLSYTNDNNGQKVSSFISDGAHWWLGRKGKTILPSASWSCSTNTTFANVTNTITLDTVEMNNGAGIYLDNSGWFTPGIGSRIWVTNAGTYMLTFSAVWSKVGATAENGDIWIRQNGVDIPRTMTLITIPNASTNCMTVNFMLPVTGVTYFDLQGASPGGNGQLQAMPAISSPFKRPACPSVIVTLNKTSD